MASFADRIRSLGYEEVVDDNALFQWTERSRVLTFLTEKLLKGKTVRELCNIMRKEGQEQAESPEDDRTREVSGLLQVLTFLGIPATHQDIEGQGGKENRVRLLNRLVEIVENLPGNAVANEEDTKKRDIEVYREGMAANVALITAAIRSRKGCLRPKLNPLPTDIMTNMDDLEGSTMEDVFNALSDVSVALDAARLEERLPPKMEEKEDENHLAFKEALLNVKNAMIQFNERVKRFMEEYPKSHKESTHHSSVQGLGPQATAILAKFNRIMEVSSSIRNIKALRDAIMPDKAEDAKVDEIIGDAQNAAKIAMENCKIMQQASERVKSETCGRNQSMLYLE
ncbi:hypothetical protein BSKO_07883 [Bryopsis sp. KO-2023]|nr:hypothetical protein BSKO_07883 [Bryopsis sp. KO-2023]